MARKPKRDLTVEEQLARGPMDLPFLMLVMILLSRLKGLSVYGVSIGGAAAHNCGQVAAAVLTLGNPAPLYYLPVLLGVSLGTGALTGEIGRASCRERV